MKAVFRADSSNIIGSGHIIRCITLAKELRKKDVECIFVCRDHLNNISSKILESEFELVLLPNMQDKYISNNNEINFDEWLGSSLVEDAQETNEILKTLMPEWLIVDHYSINKKWEDMTAKYTKFLMVIDDIADREHSCDILLDQNFYLDKENRYDGKVPKNCVKMLGPKYALLQEDFIKIRDEIESNEITNKTSINNVFIFFGGSDNFNLTELSLLALDKCFDQNVSIDIVLSSKNNNYAN